MVHALIVFLDLLSFVPALGRIVTFTTRAFFHVLFTSSGATLYVSTTPQLPVLERWK